MQSKERVLSQKDKTIPIPSASLTSYALPFEIIPAQVVFKDIEINQYYEITVEIRNLTNRAKRIRFQNINNPNFKIHYIMQAEIAPGLSTTAKIKYQCKELKTETEIIKVFSEDGSFVELPVRVYKMESQILFEPFLDMGFLKLNKEHSQSVSIKNNGKAPGTIQFSHDHAPYLTVEPKILKIAPQQQSSISIKYKPTEPGLFKGSILLKSESILVKDRIDIHATSVDYARYVVDDKANQTTNFDFGTLYAGEQSIIKAFIVNNSPKVMPFKTIFRKGYLTSSDEFLNVQTPHEIGTQQNQRIMFIDPEDGHIDPFQQKQVKLICRTKTTYRDHVYTNSYALTPTGQQSAINHKKNSHEFKPQTLYEYSIMLNSEGDDPIFLQLKANAVCPQIKIQSQIVQFGDCCVRSTLSSSYTVENKSNISKAEISFPKIPNFTIVPPLYILKPTESTTFQIRFQPKTIGKIDSIQKLLINKIYSLDIRCFGIATTEQSRSRKRIESIRLNPSQAPTLTQQPQTKTRGKAFSLVDRPATNQMRLSIQHQQLMKLQFTQLHQNKQKFNQFLIDRRTQRLDKQKQEIVQKKWSLYQNKLQYLGGSGKYEEKLDEDGIPINPPIDYEFETGMNDTKLKKQNILMPPIKSRLFVTKHIGNYEPMTVSSAKTDKFTRTALQAPKKVFSDQPSNYNHKRQITMQLQPQQLSAIEVSSHVITFEDVYIKSKESRYFWVRNSTKKTISMMIKYSSPELSRSYKIAQVIPSGAEAGFEVVFCKDTLGDFKGTAKYVINELHEFQMSITARSVPVEINVDRTQIKFQFDPTSLQNSTTETIILQNSGNGNAFFKFILTKEKIYIPKIFEGTLKPKQKLSVPITMTMPMPTVKKNEYNYTQRLLLKVLDGNEVIIICNHTVVDPKYTTKCDMFTNPPIICVGHELNEVLEVKNVGKNAIVFQIQGQNLDISENVKINPDQTRKIKVKFQSKVVGKFDCSITIASRGGQKKTIETTITVIQPQLQFSSETLNLGLLVVQGISGSLTFTLKNKSIIDLPLLIDIRSNKYKSQNPKHIQNLTLQLLDQQQKLQVIHPTIHSQANQYELNIGENLVGKDVDEDDLDGSESDQQKIVEKNQQEFRKYRLMIKSGKVYTFKVEFFPKEAGNYELFIPMVIEKSMLVANPPKIICEALKPQFLFEPSTIDFKRKIVTKPDRSYPKFLTVTISNIDDDQVTWLLKDDDIRKQGIFTIQTTKGVLKPKQKLQFRVSFNPYKIGQYLYKLPLLISNRKLPQPTKYVDVVLKGLATLPALFFNKRQVILPVVPLDIQTTSSFRIINDGYQNCNLKCQFLDDVANIGVRTSFPQGISIGITKQKIKIDLAWRSSRAISFCLKLQFTDDMNRSFTVPISGTADNCIFTNYTYFLRNQGKFHIKSDPSLQLIQTHQSSSGTLIRKNSTHSLQSGGTNKSIRSYLGVAPISPALLGNTIDYINRYLNSNLVTIPISTFPNSLIECDGAQLFEILSFVSSKPSNFPWRYTGQQKGPIKATKIYQQYSELIKMLKIQGAHLNHIRPEHLLSFTDLNTYLNTLPPQKSKVYMPSLLKINAGLFHYLSMDSWITLLYQIFKIYVLSRVTPKNYKSHLSISSQVPAHCLTTSNFSSISQNILFYWCQQAVAEVLLEQRRLTNFDKDFRDSTVIASLLQKYANVPILKQMKVVCTLQQDYIDNATILCNGLSEIGMQNHITPKDIYNPMQRQMLLFILHLYVYLPFYTPKQDAIVFKCVLGDEVIRTIELTNPSNKPVSYLAKFEGCDDFKLLSDVNFRIQPKQTHKFEIKFVSRISNAVKGRIMFINVKQKSLTAAALVFQLRSEIIGRVSDRIWNISGLIYEQIEFQIEVANKFIATQLVDFTITYQTDYQFQLRNKSKTTLPIPLPKQQQLQTIYGKVDNIRIRKNSSTTLTLNYIPMSMYTTKTTIFFINPIVGQFQHQIVATVQPPAIIAEIRPPMLLVVDQIVQWGHPVTVKNDMIVRAKKVIQSLKKNRKGVPQIQSSKQATKTAINDTTSQQYQIQISDNPYISSKDWIILSEKCQERAEKLSDKKKTKEDNSDLENKIPFTIVCKNPIYEFATYVLLSNRSKTDVRRYRVIFTIQPKPLKAILEMTVPARSQVTQNLPIVNNTQRDWSIKINWQPDPQKNGHYFLINPQYLNSFPVKRNSIGNFPITFKPKWAYQAQAKLIMNNPLTLDNFQYQIIGNGQQPLAQQHIQIHCEAKQLLKKQLIIKNPYSEKSITFRIETDLLNCQAPKKLTIPPGSKQKYQFTIQPILCGQYTGSLTFFEEDGQQYIWYTIAITTNYPEAYKTIVLESQIRKRCIEVLHLPYNAKKDGEYQVIINGSGLIGANSVAMKANIDNTYQLEYLPLELGEQKGSICFINPDIGELLIEINLKCYARPPTIINNIKSPLGVSTIINAELQNPTTSKISIIVANSNSEQFVIKNLPVRLAPLEKKVVQVEYVPASLDVVQSASIVFKSKEIGDWTYELSGMGMSPVPFPTYVVYNGLGEQHSDSIKFRNPFKYKITVGIKLLPSTSSDSQFFHLVNSLKNRFQIQSFGILQIPFSFIPSACSMYQCSIQVMISQKIFWIFPIRGITQINQGKTLVTLTTACRQSTSQYIQIALEGITNYSSNNLYSYSFQNIPAVYQPMVDKFFTIEVHKASFTHANDTLEFQFGFKPMKPGKIIFDFLISRQQGSRWRYKIVLEGNQPQPDDVIQIQSSLMATSTVSFKITNWEKVNTAFKAKFTSDSAHQFSVEPKDGILSKFGGKGTNFYISYTPVQYGKEKKGKLIIETADMYWSYLLKGSLPKYVPPKIQGSRTRIYSQRT